MHEFTLCLFIYSPFIILEVQMLKKQSFYIDELTKARNELTSAHKKILEKEGCILKLHMYMHYWQ